MKKIRTAMELHRAKVLAERRCKLKIADFHPREKFVSSRIAEFLFWAAERYPKCVITHEEITQAIFSLGAVPKPGSKQVDNVRKSVGRARSVMREKYKRDIVTEKGIGARATVDSADAVATSVVREVTNYERSCNRLRDAASLVNQKELEDALNEKGIDPVDREEILTLRDWFTEKVMKVVKKLEQPQSRLALPLPPQIGEEPA